MDSPVGAPSDLKTFEFSCSHVIDRKMYDCHYIEKSFISNGHIQKFEMKSYPETKISDVCLYDFKCHVKRLSYPKFQQ